MRFRIEWERENRGKNGELRPSAKIPIFLDNVNWLDANDWVALQHLEDILTSFKTVLTRLKGMGRSGAAPAASEGHMVTYGMCFQHMNTSSLSLSILKKLLMASPILSSLE